MKVKVKNNITEELLKSVGFHIEDGIWNYRKEVYKGCVEMVVRIWFPDEEDDHFSSDIIIVDKGTNTVYAAYYNDFGKDEVVKEVRKNVDSTTRYLVHKGIFAVVNKRKTFCNDK